MSVTIPHSSACRSVLFFAAFYQFSLVVSLVDGLYPARIRLYLLRAIIRLGLAHVVFRVTWERSHLMWDGCPVSHSTFTFICMDEDFLVRCFTFVRSNFGLPFFPRPVRLPAARRSQPFAFFCVYSCRNCTAYGRRLSVRLRYH